MSGPERPTDAIVRLLRQAGADQPAAGQIIVKGDGNVFGDVITVNNKGPLNPPRRSDRRVLRASAINYIRSLCRRTGDPLAWLPFARAEFGVVDLHALTDLQLERVRGWCAAKEERQA